MPELIATVKDGKASVKERSKLLPFVYGIGQGYRLIVHDLGFSHSEQPDETVTRHEGIKVELLSKEDEAAVILPPDVVQNFRKWLNNLLFLKTTKKKEPRKE